MNFKSLLLSAAVVAAVCTLVDAKQSKPAQKPLILQAASFPFDAASATFKGMSQVAQFPVKIMDRVFNQA